MQTNKLTIMTKKNIEYLKKRQMQTNKLTILIIDDSEIVRKQLMEMLCEIKGVEWVKAAECAEEGLELALTLKPMLVILDLSMPYTSGVEIIPKLKQISPSPILIVLTNYSDSIYQEHCINLGADYFLDKSLDFDKILDITKNLPKAIKLQTKSQVIKLQIKPQCLQNFS